MSIPFPIAEAAIAFNEEVVNRYLTPADRFIFWIGGGIVFLVTSFLLAGSLRFKELRKQPGDLIVGIAFSDFMLAIHWIALATWPTAIDEPSFCFTVGGIGIFAAASEFYYNIGFSIFMIISLRNALKQAKIPKKSFHIIILGVCTSFLLYAALTDKIGKTIAGTCSMKSKSGKANFNALFGPLLALLYSALGIYTYAYIRKNAPRCAQAHAKRSKFLLYYSRYIMASSAVYALVAVITLFTVFVEGPIFFSIWHVTKLASPLVLSFIRYNDPFIKKIMIATLLFWKKDYFKVKEKPVLVHSGTAYVRESLLKESKNPTDLETQDHDEEFMFNALSGDRRIELVYTLLASVMYSDISQRRGIDVSQQNTFDKHTKNIYKHERIVQMGDDCVSYLFPSIKTELDRNKFSLLPGTLKTYAPEVFMEMVNEDKEYLNLQESLDFRFNREQIRDASGPGGGKSGEFFFFSRDKKLIIKTIPDVELNMLRDILERYQDHFKQYPNTLIAKVYGAMTFESTELGQKLNIIVMKNVSGYPSKYVSRSYDMKGSRYDREVCKGMSNVYDETILGKLVLKDLDFEKFEQKFNIRKDQSEALMKQIEADANFFKRVKLIDYSMMVFCINKTKYLQAGHFIKDEFVTKNPVATMENLEMPGMHYHIGIVDYLQPYNMQKRIEKYMKKITQCNMKLDTSSQNPTVYAERFIDFFKKLV